MMIIGMTSKSRAILNRKYASILLLTQQKDQLQPPQPPYKAPEELLEQDEANRTESKQKDDQWVMDDKHSHKDGWQWLPGVEDEPLPAGHFIDLAAALLLSYQETALTHHLS